MQTVPSFVAMTLALFLGLGGGSDKSPDPDAVFLFKGDDVKAFSMNACGKKQDKKRPEFAILCDSAWRPMELPVGDKAPVQVYRLFLAKPSKQPVILRVSTYEDGSGSLWVTTFVKDEMTMKPIARAQVADLSPADLASLLPRIDQSQFWTLTETVPGVKVDPKVMDKPDCAGQAVWVLEGRRADAHRALAVRTCTVGKWLLNLDADVMALARAKVPGL